MYAQAWSHQISHKAFNQGSTSIYTVTLQLLTNLTYSTQELRNKSIKNSTFVIFFLIDKHSLRTKPDL